MLPRSEPSVHDELRSFDDPDVWEVSVPLAEIEAQGGLALVPHPFRKSDGLFRAGLERLEFFRDRTAGFELFSAKCSYAENQRARELLASPLAPFGGSDAHYECDLGESLNVLRWEGDLKSSVVRMLQRLGRSGHRPLATICSPEMSACARACTASARRLATYSSRE